MILIHAGDLEWVEASVVSPVSLINIHVVQVVAEAAAVVIGKMKAEWEADSPEAVAAVQVEDLQKDMDQPVVMVLPVAVSQVMVVASIQAEEDKQDSAIQINKDGTKMIMEQEDPVHKIGVLVDRVQKDGVQVVAVDADVKVNMAENKE